jgi:hypothetical protein
MEEQVHTHVQLQHAHMPALLSPLKSYISYISKVIYIYIYIYIYITDIYIYIYTNTHLYIYTHTFIYMYI